MKRLLPISLLIWAGVVSAADTYIRDESLDGGGAYLVGEIEVAPRFLVERFGKPGPGDDPTEFKKWVLAEYKAWLEK